jgi:hypothetical protein
LNDDESGDVTAELAQRQGYGLTTKEIWFDSWQEHEISFFSKLALGPTQPLT